MPPATPGGPVTRIGLDASQADSEIDRLRKKITLLSGGMKALAVASTTYNQAGKITDAVLRGLTDKGTQMDIFIKKVKGGWEIVAQTTKQSIDRMIRDQERLDKETKKNAANAKAKTQTNEFRAKLAGYQRSQIPGGATQVDQRFFINAQRDLEKFVAAGDLTSARATKILEDLRNGVKGRLRGVEEDFRVAALRMFAAAQKVRERFNSEAEKQQARINSTQVKGVLDSAFGRINPAATTGAVGRIENSYNRLAASVESAGVPLARFQDLVTKTMAGVADPTNKAERSVVRLVKSITAEYDKATQSAAKLTAAGQRVVDAGDFKTFAQGRLGKSTSGLGELDAERVQAQISRIQNLIQRSTNSLTAAGARAAFDAGLKGATNGFQGVEEQARKSGARIRQIITGQLKDPFGIKLAIDNNIGTIRGLYSARFLTQLTRDFEQVVEKAAEFQRSIALIQTITQDVHVPFDTWADSIRKVSDELGKPIAEVAAAGYDVLSNQVTKNVEDTMSVLRTAGQFARITNSSTEDSINLLSSAINTFKLTSGDADRVAAQFFTTIDLGRVKTNEMANTIGRSAVYAKTLGVSLEELQAGIITITQTGQKADSSFTLLNNVFQKLLNPTKELQEYYDRLGVGTGEVFVKTYGFTGALRMLQKETQGSAAKLADFFNEIRAFGGIDALISRSTVFEGALKSLGKEAQENADKAKKAFDNLPGQRFLEEMNKIKNLFLTTFQTGALKTILALTDGFGGLASVIKATTAVSVGLGTALGLAWVVNKVEMYVSAVLRVTGVMSALGDTTKSLALAQQAAWGAGVLGIVLVAAVLGKLYQDTIDYYDMLKEKADEAANKQIEANSRAESEIRKQYENTLKAEQKRVLEVLADQVKAGQERVRIAEETNKKIAESTKNAFENAYGSARATVEELRNRQKEAIKDAVDFGKTGRARITNDRDENLFRNRLTRNDAANGGNAKVERELYRNRLRQLNNLINAAAAKGDMATATRFLDQKDQILNEIANKTVNIRGRTFVKYTGADQALIKNAEYRFQIEKKIADLRAKEALGLQSTINQETDKLSALEDAYKEVYGFKLEDNGKPIDKDADAALKRYDEKVARAKRLTQEFQQGAGQRDPTMSRNLFHRQTDLAFGRGADVRNGIIQRFADTNDLAALRKQQDEAIQRLGDDAVERFNLASQKAEEAKTAYIKAFGAADVELKNLMKQKVLDEENPLASVLGRRIDPANPINRLLNGKTAVKRAELENSISSSFKGGNFDLALKELNQLIELYKSAGALQRRVLGAGGSRITLDAALQNTRRAILAARAKGSDSYAADQVRNDAQKQTPKNNDVLASLEKSLRALGPSSKAVTEAMIADQAKYQVMLKRTNAALSEIINKRNAIGPNKAEEAQAEYDKKAGIFTPRTGTVIDGAGKVEERASGGYIHPGRPRGTDTIPAWLTEGEYIMPADKTAKYRSVLERMRAGYFASGGEIQIGGQTVIDALTGGIYGKTKGIMSREEKKLAERLKSLAPHLRHSRAGSYGPADFESTPLGDMGFADGGIVGDFAAQLKALNSGFGVGSLGAGGDTTTVGDINITVQGGDTGKTTVQEMGRELDRALRRKAITLRTNR